MKLVPILLFAGIALTTPAISHAQVAGSTLIGVSVTEMRDGATGWSTKRQILGQPVFNDKDERVGSIDDIIVAPDKAVSYAIINAGGVTGLAKQDVATPLSQLKLGAKTLVLRLSTPTRRGWLVRRCAVATRYDNFRRSCRRNDLQHRGMLNSGGTQI